MVLDGIWPYELMQPRPETEQIARYLHQDLQRIVARANRHLADVAQAGMPAEQQFTEERRLVNVARAMAVLRVESTVRILGGRSMLATGEVRTVDRAIESKLRPSAAPDRGPRTAPPGPVNSRPLEPEPVEVHEDDRVRRREPAPRARHDAADPDIVDVTVVAPAPVGGAGVVVSPSGPKPAAVSVERDERPVVVALRAVGSPPPVLRLPETKPDALRRVLGVMARQQPALTWLVGERGDGSMVVMTDVMSGWIPPGTVVPPGAVVLGPARRAGRMEDWEALEPCVGYGPGQRIDSRASVGRLVEEPFAVVDVEELGGRLGDATRRATDLPRLAHELAAARAAGADVLDAERDVLSVYVETAVQSMLAQYPRVSGSEAVSCMLLAAAEAMAAGQTVLAAYHFGWYDVFAGRR